MTRGSDCTECSKSYSGMASELFKFTFTGHTHAYASTTVIHAHLEVHHGLVPVGLWAVCRGDGESELPAAGEGAECSWVHADPEGAGDGMGSGGEQLHVLLRHRLGWGVRAVAAHNHPLRRAARRCHI